MSILPTTLSALNFNKKAIVGTVLYAGGYIVPELALVLGIMLLLQYTTYL